MQTPRQLQPLPSMRGDPPTLAPSRPRRRWRLPLLVVALGVVATAALGGQDDDPTVGVADRSGTHAPTEPAAMPSDTPGAAAGTPADPDTAPADGTGSPTRGAGEADDAGDRVAPAADPSIEQEPVAPTPLARVGALTIGLPPGVLLVGYHEASLKGALEMVPWGRVATNENTTKFSPPGDRQGGAEYHVMSSRGRRFPATSAVDLVMNAGTDVLSPVTGTVTDVRPYRLYGTHDDTRLEIEPDDAPHLRVVMIHVADVRVRTGDQVVAGTSVLAGTPNQFPFSSHVDRYLERRLPHVHLEVKDPTIAEPLPEPTE